MADTFPMLRAELPALAKALGLKLSDGLPAAAYRIDRGSQTLLYASTPQEVKAFLRGYQHGSKAEALEGLP